MQYFGEPEGFLIFCAVGGIRRVQISCDICTRFACYLYSTKQSWIINGSISFIGQPETTSEVLKSIMAICLFWKKIVDLRL